ncbi:pyridine nucleotide-disulfide oxidoreductase [Candidatus Poribacteria bacterium]|nr:MAG: pyridine nucleotide-disulfide oxidoreductase [Candidatus Poribacteria bacterium]
MTDYDLTIIGGGSAGLVLAVAGAKLGKKTALIEKHRIGGDCLWTGCVPSKALLKVAKVANEIQHAEKYGFFREGEVFNRAPDFQQAMAYVRSTQQKIEEEHDNPERFRGMGVDVIFGSGHFMSPQRFVVNGAGENHAYRAGEANSGEMRTLTSKKFVISTGSRPAVPPIPGIENCDYLDSETVWELEELPKRLLVVGAGPIGVELGQAFHRLGAAVTIAQRGNRILTKEDADVSACLLNCLREEGITIRLNTQITRIDTHIASAAVERGPVPRHPQSSPENVVNVTFRDDKNNSTEQEFDKILIAAGRAPNVEGLGLEGLGVNVNKRGIEVNNKLQTRVKNIYAAGDVIGHYLFTHVAAYQAQLLLRNIFFPLSRTIDYSVVPWTTFCEPEVARCGLTEAEAREKYGDVDVFTLPQADVDRAVAEGETRGFTKVIASRWRGKILGVHLVGANAGEVLHEYVLAMQHGIPLHKLSGMMHVYPTFSSSVWRVAGKWFSESTPIQLFRKLISH